MAKFAFSRSPAFATNAQGGVVAAQNMSAQQLDELYNSPAAPESEVMTVDDTIAKTVGAFALLLVGAAVGWLSAPLIPLLWIGAALVGLVLGLVNSFKREPSAALILLYAAVEGVFVGGISWFYESAFGGGIVVQAVIASLVVVGVTLALFASGKIRASKRATKIFLIAMIGYGVFSLVNLVLMVTGASTDPWGLRSVQVFGGIPLGLILGVFVVLMAAYSLVLDFDFIQRGVANKAPRKYGWTGAFGIMATVIWLYLEILRMLAISRR
jgi:uncharacterized YccA/Bax inhibitor family protein